MLTMPTKFTQHHMRGGANNHIIVKIVSGASTWLFSDVDMQLTDGAVYGLLIDGTTVDQSVDYRECMVNTSEVELRFSNVKYNPYGTAPRLSELWAALGGVDTVDIYLGAGPITAISDCLRIFAGKISGLPSFTELEVVINVKDTGAALLETMLPDTIVSSIYPTCIFSSRDKYLPIIYGSFVFPGESFRDSYGTVTDGNKSLIGSPSPTILLSEKETKTYAGSTYVEGVSQLVCKTKKFAICDNALHGRSGAWFSCSEIGDGVLCELRQGSNPLNITDLPQAYDFDMTSGSREVVYIRIPERVYFDDLPVPTPYTEDTQAYERIEPTIGTTLGELKKYLKAWYLGAARAYLYPNVICDDNLADDPSNAFSDDPSYATIPAYANDLIVSFGQNAGGGTSEVGPLLEDEYTFAVPTMHLYGKDVVISNVLWAYISSRWSVSPGASIPSYGYMTVSSAKGEKFISNDAPPSDINFHTAANANHSIITGDDEDVFWLRGWGHDAAAINWDLLTGNPNDNQEIRLSFKPADGTPSEGELVRVYAIRLILEFDYTAAAIKENNVFVECTGMPFSSWIDNENHSNSFDEDDAIEHAPYIVESLLIDRLSVAEADIDHASFDRAYDSNVEARIALHTDERRTVREIFNELGLQSLFAVHYSASGKWRLIPLYGASTAASAIIRWGNVEPDSFRISQGSLDDIVNSLAYKYCYRYDLDEAIWSGAASDSASITKYGTKKGDFTFRHIVEDSVAYVTNFLCGTGGYWSNPIKEISFYSPGFTYSQLDLGDIIDFDVEFDNHVLDGATSFSGEHFMIVGKNQTLEGLTIKVIPARMRA